MSKFTSDNRRIPLYGSEILLDDIWRHSLSGGMKTIEGADCRLSDFLSTQLVCDRSFLREGCEFTLVPRVHVLGNESRMLGYGLFFEVGGRRVYLTTDTKFAPRDPMPFLQRAGLVFHDCETSPVASGATPIAANWSPCRTHARERLG